MQIVRELGYHIEKFNYTTDDGYINSVYRISPKTSSNVLKNELSYKTLNLEDVDGEFHQLDSKFDKSFNYTRAFSKNEKGSTIHKRPQNFKLKDSVCILQHGIMDTAACWVLNGKNSIAIKLVDMGYDVWLNNARGSKYSRGHQLIDLQNKNLDLPEILK